MNIRETVTHPISLEILTLLLTKNSKMKARDILRKLTPYFEGLTYSKLSYYLEILKTYGLLLNENSYYYINPNVREAVQRLVSAWQELKNIIMTQKRDPTQLFKKRKLPSNLVSSSEQ